MTAQAPSTPTTLTDALTGYLPHQRWFAGKGGDVTVDDVRPVAWLGAPGDDPRLAMCLAEVTAGGRRATYQVPLSYRPERRDQLEHAYLGEHEGPDGAAHVYDAAHDRDAVVLLVRALVTNAVPDPLGAHVVAAVDVDLSGRTVVLGGEQSNTNVVVGDSLLLKLFRRVAAGRNPDIEVLSALTRQGSIEVVPLVGWLELTDGQGGASTDLVMLSEFLNQATDGWDLALTSVRDLFAERDLYPEEVGGDFAAEAHRLGQTTAQMHLELAQALPTSALGADELAAVAARMRARLDAAVAEVPDLAPHAGALADLLDRVASYPGPVPAQRVHGDLHLGQTLRTFQGWRVIDFEGEPERPLGERTSLDTPLRDVAGMLRSFDYAAQSQWADLLGDHQLAARATEWSVRNREAFLDGYAELAARDPRDDDLLLRAYEVDKAVYEAVYEARNRPGWLPIPLRAIARLVGAADPA